MLKLCFQGPPGEPGERGSPGRAGDMVTTPTLYYPKETVCLVIVIYFWDSGSGFHV